MFNDTCYYNSGIVIFYVIQILIGFFFLLFCDKAYEEFEIYNSLSFMLSNTYVIFSIIMTCSVCIIPYYILRRLEFYFGGSIVNKIKQNNYKDLLREKYYKKKVEQMTRVVRKYAKFREIYYHQEENHEENLPERKMRKNVSEFKDKIKSISKDLNKK